MQIQSIQSITPQAGASGPQSALSSYAPGDLIQAEVAEADQGQVVLRLPQGDLLRAEQQASEPLQAGDKVVLQMSRQEGESGPRLELVSVNGQPLKAAAPLSEYALLRMRVAPSQANLTIAAALAEMGAAARPETFARMAELAARYPALDSGAALLLAASSVPLSADAVEAFSQWLNSPVHTAEFASAAQSLAAQDGQAAPVLEAAAQQMQPSSKEAAPAHNAALGDIPKGVSPGLAAKLEQSGVWQELKGLLPTLPEKEARGYILQLMTDLPAETTGAERALLYNALSRMAQPAQGQPSASDAPAPGRPLAGDAGQLQAGTLPEGAEQSILNVEQQLPAERQPILANALKSLFAALQEHPAGEQGHALQEAATELESSLRAFTAALEAHKGPESGKLKPVLELGQALTSQVQMGGGLGNLLCLPLPITLHEARQDAQMYVLKRNGGADGVDASNVTVAICLETQNLGPVDTLLRVERNELTLQFRVESPRARSFFQARLAQAAKLAFPAPYHFQNASVILRDAPITPLNAGQTLQKAFGIAAPKGLDISV